MASKKDKHDAPEILNRKARYDYAITETLEVGVKLVGTEVRSIRGGKCSLGEGYVRAEATPPSLVLYGVHIDEYAPAGHTSATVENGRAGAGGVKGRGQHVPTRPRVLLAHAREIVRLANAAQVKGVTIVPLKMYFKGGRAKLLIGVGTGKQRRDKRETIKERESDRDLRRAMTKRV